jgi:hypothetical protein
LGLLRRQFLELPHGVHTEFFSHSQEIADRGQKVSPSEASCLGIGDGGDFTVRVNVACPVQCVAERSHRRTPVAALCLNVVGQISYDV